MSDLIGRKLGEYEIVEHIGHGVAADVYKAECVPGHESTRGTAVR